MKANEKNMEQKETRQSMLGDILEDLKTNWWKIALSFLTGVGTGVASAKLLDNFVESEAEPQEETPEPEAIDE